MLIKWIHCEVSSEQRDAFDRAQQQWSSLADCDGFILQVGGWNLRAKNEACVIGLWRDEASYSAFMRDIHDSITTISHQEKTYDSCRTERFDVQLRMDGTSHNLSEGISNAEVLRIARCKLRPGREERFTEVQESIWIPGMRGAGMSCGLFGKHKSDPSPTCIVISAWETEQVHAAYVDGPFRDLRRRASIEDDVSELSGALVKLLSEWTCLGQRP
ncbi:YdbC family protein [bacterium]|nr:YdbC family protein [bacterium]